MDNAKYSHWQLANTNTRRTKVHLLPHLLFLFFFKEHYIGILYLNS